MNTNIKHIAQRAAEYADSKDDERIWIESYTERFAEDFINRSMDALWPKKGLHNKKARKEYVRNTRRIMRYFGVE